MKARVLSAGVSFCLFVLLAADSATAQFDFGEMFRSELRQGMQQVEGQVRGEIQDEIQKGLPQIIPPHPGGDGNRILPYPPLHLVDPPAVIFPQPTCPPENRPPVTTLPYPNSIYPSPQPSPIVTQPAPTPGCTIRPITEPKPEPELPVVTSGQLIEVDGNGFGVEPGAIFVTVDKLVLHVEVREWRDTVVAVRIPQLPLADSTLAQIVVVTANEEVVERLEVRIDPPADTKDSALTPPDDNAVASEDLELPVVSVGSEITLEGDALGERRGIARLFVGALEIDASIVAWSDREATVRLPQMDLAESAQAQIRLLDASGKLITQVTVTLVASADVATID